MRTIKFTAYGATQGIGEYGPGDVMRCHESMARHLVEQARCAVYVEAATHRPAPEQGAVRQAAAVRRKGKSQ